jgi:hypothetical protein
MKIKSVYRLTFICCIVFLLPLQDFGQKKNENSDLRHWPAGSTPQEIGKRLAEHFVIRPLPVAPGKVLYPEVCTWYGALTFASLTKDTKLIASLEERFKPLLGADSVLIPIPNHVDNTVFGSVPLELYLITKDLKYLTLGKRIADRQWASPDSTQVTHNAKVFYGKGFTPQTRMWIDDMFMITAVQVQAYRATGDKKYIERAAKEMVLYLDSLQRPNGLFFHAPDVPFFWSRGNGWMAAGMSEHSQGQFMNALNISKQQLKIVRADAQDIKQFYQSTIKTDLQELRTQKRDMHPPKRPGMGNYTGNLTGNMTGRRGPGGNLTMEERRQKMMDNIKNRRGKNNNTPDTNDNGSVGN